MWSPALLDVDFHETREHDLLLNMAPASNTWQPGDEELLLILSDAKKTSDLEITDSSVSIRG
jgi:hypothetical protein